MLGKPNFSWIDPINQLPQDNVIVKIRNGDNVSLAKVFNRKNHSNLTTWQDLDGNAIAVPDAWQVKL